MLIRRQQLDEIAAGRVTLAFRRWTRPTVKTGGTLRTAVGVLAIDSVDPIAAGDITVHDAEQAGYASRADLLADLDQRTAGVLYRIRFRMLGDDPRIALRNSTFDVAGLDARLRKLDGPRPWTEAVLDLIAANEGVRAAELAQIFGQELHRFKLNVRKLKELGLTESLHPGYRLSPRGRAHIALKRSGNE